MLIVSLVLMEISFVYLAIEVFLMVMMMMEVLLVLMELI
jgi:hypothetical protein